MKIYFATDHAGLAHKDKLFAYLAEHDYELIDYGAFELDEGDDYPDFVAKAARSVALDRKSVGIIFGGSGQGEAIVANRFRGVRCAVYNGGDRSIVELSRRHNNANMLSIGARFVTETEMKEVVEAWLATKFEKEERHVRRLKKIELEARKGTKSQKIERFGWLGVVLILSAYIANILGVLNVTDSGYLLANLAGSIFVLVDARQDENMQAVVINAAWIIFAVVGIVRYLL